MLNIIIVCTGNTCRSPMAAALLEDKAAKAGFKDKMRISSAGLAVGGPFPASRGAHTVMKERGLSLSNHRSRQLTRQDLMAADLILTMTENHKDTILSFLPEVKSKLFTLPEFAGTAGDVADPFGWDAKVYAECAEQISRLIDQVWEKIVALAGKKG